MVGGLQASNVVRHAQASTFIIFVTHSRSELKLLPAALTGKTRQTAACPSC